MASRVSLNMVLLNMVSKAQYIHIAKKTYIDLTCEESIIKNIFPQV